jgi:type IV secretory pathway TrbF-like protein
VAPVSYSSSTAGPPNGPASGEDIGLAIKAYEELRQRDGYAERRERTWRCFALLALLATFAVGAWDHLDRRESVRAFVQPVQVTEEGRVINVGLPQDLLSYEPSDGQWLDMVTRWVVAIRWRGSDETRMRYDWNWARAHLCGETPRLVDQMERDEQPFKDVGRRLVSVSILSATPSPRPRTYHVYWEEFDSDAAGQKPQRYTGTFTVGRFVPPSTAVLLQNHLGLCLEAINITPQSGDR